MSLLKQWQTKDTQNWIKHCSLISTKKTKKNKDSYFFMTELTKPMKCLLSSGRNIRCNCQYQFQFCRVLFSTFFYILISIYSNKLLCPLFTQMLNTAVVIICRSYRSANKDKTLTSCCPKEAYVGLPEQ